VEFERWTTELDGESICVAYLVQEEHKRAPSFVACVRASLAWCARRTRRFVLSVRKRFKRYQDSTYESLEERMYTIWRFCRLRELSYLRRL